MASRGRLGGVFVQPVCREETGSEQESIGCHSSSFSISQGLWCGEKHASLE